MREIQFNVALRGRTTDYGTGQTMQQPGPRVVTRIECDPLFVTYDGYTVERGTTDPESNPLVWYEGTILMLLLETAARNFWSYHQQLQPHLWNELPEPDAKEEA